MVRKFLVVLLCFMIGGVGAFFALIKTELKHGEEKRAQSAEEENYWKIVEKIEGMTLDEKIGQLLFVRVPAENASLAIEKYNFGGYILFDRDLQGKTLESVAEEVKTWQKASKTPMFIGIDEEGGVVSRLSYNGFADFGSPQELFSEGGFELQEDAEIKKIELLRKIGVNVNFAPVVDTCTNENAFIYDRSFGRDAEKTAEFAENIVKSYDGSGISATLKHFPGYGDNMDTHSGIAIDERSLMEFEEADFLPFKVGIRAGADFVMFSHNIIKNVDGDNPASLSKELHRILAEDLGFQGIMVTDDLSMDAVNSFYNGAYEKEVQAVLAGNNMLLVSDYEGAFQKIKDAVENGVLSEQEIEEAIWPVLIKKWLPRPDSNWQPRS